MSARVTALVKNPHSLVVYWQTEEAAVLPAGACLRILDLTGRAPDQSLDGLGYRLIGLVPDQHVHHVGSLLPDRLYGVEFGYIVAGQFQTLASATPVHTPWDHPAGNIAGLENFVPGSRS